MENETVAADSVRLRRLAEKALGEAADDNDDLSGQSPEEISSLIHELRVHQIELEMQNEELRRTQEALEKTRHRYSHLYDFAPVGYFSISEKGMIEATNLTFASMLKADRGTMVGKPLSQFILNEDQDIYYKHRRRLLETEASQACDLRFVKKDGQPFYARLECMLLKSEGEDVREIRAAISDITESILAQKERDKLISDLQKTLSEVKVLRGFLPICSYCKQIRDDKGYWSQIESYLLEHADTKFSHSICPECANKYFPGQDIYSNKQTQE